MTQKKVLGILGGGQLGRMSALAAARLGIKCHIYAPDDGCPASLVSSGFTCASYTDEQALSDFARQVDVISYEFENIPVETVRYLQKLKPVYPDDKLLDIAQNRLNEKTYLNKIGIGTARFCGASSVDELKAGFQTLDIKEGIIKTARFGYDGKGQVYHRDTSSFIESFNKLNSTELIIEEVVDFVVEISVVVARNEAGEVKPYPPVFNEHRNHILAKTTFPAPIDDALKVKATQMAVHLANSVSLVGVLALELFVTRSGDILANEIAPRTHNSGHWTIDACCVSQFEQHVRAVCGLPLGNPEPHHTAEMINLIGDDMRSIGTYLSMEKACVHLYGKEDIKEGRKMGHVTILKEAI